MAGWKNTLLSYGLTAKSFHWVMAFLMLAMLMMGFYMVGLESSPFKFFIFGWHKSWGTVILLLAMLRLSWKFINIAPAHLPSHQKWEITLAKIVHVLLYVVMFAMPLSGWIMSSAADFRYSFFGLFDMPHIVPKNETIFKIAVTAHVWMAYAIVGIVGLHVAGALKHHFIDKDETLQRMSSRKVGFKWGVVITLLVAAVFLKIGCLWLFGSDEETALVPTAPAVVQSETTSPVVPVEGGWVIDAANSAITFSATQYGSPFEGKFEKFDGQIVFDPNDLATAKADITIDIASIKTGTDDRDANAKGAEWFDTAQFPQAHFKSESFESKGANQYVTHGSLTIRGVMQNADLPFTLQRFERRACGGGLIMDGKLILNRQAFGIGQGQWQKDDVIGNEVDVIIHVQVNHPASLRCLGLL